MGTTSRTFMADDKHNAMVTLDTNRYEIHEGHAFITSDYASGVTATNTVQWYLNTGAKECHLAYEITTNQTSKVQFHSSIAVTATNSGSLVTVYNLNRASTTTASTALYQSGTVTTSGAIMNTLYIGGTTGQKVQGGGLAGSFNEVILAADAQYMIKAIPLTGTGNYCLNIAMKEN